MDIINLNEKNNLKIFEGKIYLNELNEDHILSDCESLSNILTHILLNSEESIEEFLDDYDDILNDILELDIEYFREICGDDEYVKFTTRDGYSFFAMSTSEFSKFGTHETNVKYLINDESYLRFKDSCINRLRQIADSYGYEIVKK